MTRTAIQVTMDLGFYPVQQPSETVFADAHSVDEKAEVCGGSWLALENVFGNLVEVGFELRQS